MNPRNINHESKKLALVLILAASLFTTACSNPQGDDNPNTGGITANAVWPEATADGAVMPAALGTVSNYSPLADMPAEVVTMRFEVSGPGMDTMTKDFLASTKSGTMNGVPVGDNRVLKMIGLNSSGNAIFEGSSSTLSVYPGQVSSAGAIQMGAVIPTGVEEVPGPVTGFTATSGNAQVTLTWSNPTDASFAGVRIVRRNDGSYPASPLDGTKVYEGTDGTYTDQTNISNGTTYFYAAFAYSSDPYYSTKATASATPSASDTTPPGEVTGLSASVGNGQITLNWTNPSDSDFAGVIVRRSSTAFPPAAGSGTSVYNDLGTSVTDTGLTNGTVYYYTVFTYDGTNYSTGTQISATPVVGTPTGLSVSAPFEGASLEITWGSVSGATGYNLYRGEATGVTQLTGTKIADVTSPYTDSSLTNGTEYFYVVTAIDANSESADSTEASGTPTYVAPPAPPTVNSVTSPTVVSSQTISGTKEANTSIWMNDVQVVPLDSNTDWSVTVYFTADETSSGTPTDGTYTYSFRARYASTATSAPTEVSIDFSTNTAPVAVITYSPDFPAFGNTVTVYGTGSYDNEADTLSYSWTLNKPAGSSAGLASTNTATTSFTVDKTGDYTVYLTVNDGTVDSPTVNVTITIPNTAPVADFTVNPANPAAGNTITVDGRVSSDNENDTLSYSWTLDRPVGSNAALANATAATTTFTADVVGDYTARLTVFDGTDYSTETAKLISVIEPPDSFSINGTIYTEGSINPDDPWIFSYRDITQPFGILTYVYMLTNDDGLGNYDKYFMLIAAGDTTGTYPIDNYLNATATYQANGTSDLVYYADDLNVPGENLVITSYGDVDQPITGTYMANLCYWEYDKCDGVPYNPENFYGTFTATRDPDLGSSLNPQYEIYTRHGVRSIFGANYYQVDVEPWVDVEVRITNVTDDVGLAVYTDSTYTNAISCTTATTGPGTSDEVCLFPGLGGVLPFAVSYNGIGTEAEYDVNVISKSTLTFGTADLPHNGTAYNVGIQLFQITGLTAGQTYTVNLTNISNDVDLFVYDLPDRTNLLCSSEGFADETCDVIAPGNMLYVAVDNYWGDSGDTYTLDVQQYIPSYPVLNYPAEFPYVKNTTVAYGYSEVFQVNTLGSGYYYISLTNLTEDIDLYVYDDAGLGNLLCSSTTYNNEYCWVLSSGTSFYVMLENWGTLGAPFTLDVELSQYHIEDLPVPHVTEDSGRRVYRVTGLYPGADYVVALTDVSNDVNLSVYEDPGLINLICFPFQGWQMDEICQITATGDSLYIAVDNSYGTAGDSYTLFVQHDFVYLDSFNLPATFSTSVGSGQSEYYYIYGLMSGWNTFELSSISGDVDLYVYDDPALTQLVCQSNNIGPTTEMCQGNLSFMEAYIKVLNKGGIGNSYTLHAYY